MNDLFRVIMKSLRAVAVLPPAVFFMLAVMSSCRSHKEGLVTSSSGITARSSHGDGSSESRFVSVIDDDSNWEAVRLPVTLRLESPAVFSVSGSATLVRDSIIFMSFRMFGFEVAQIFLSGDDVMLIDKYHKKYFKASAADLLKGFDPGIGRLQAILLGQPFVTGQPSDLTFSDEDDGSWIASGEMDDIGYGFIFDSKDLLSGFAVRSESLRAPATFSYTGPTGHGSACFASQVNVSVPLGNKDKTVLASIEWNFGKAVWDNDVERRGITVPSGYQAMSMDEILKLFGR